MSSKSAAIIKAYGTAIANGLTPGQLSDLVNRISEDLDKVYTTVFSGPIPADSIVTVNRTALPDKIAWTDLANIFTEDQTIQKNYGTWKVLFDGVATQPSRFQSMGDGITLLGAGVSYDGTFHDDGGNGSAITLNNGNAFEVIKIILGVVKNCLQVANGGQTTIGPLTVLTNLLINELGLANSKSIRGLNAAGNDNLSMIFLDGNNLVQLGGNAASGDGAVAIPKNTAANLPAAGGTRNGIIALDTTNNRLCYWVGGNRYFIPIGTIF